MPDNKLTPVQRLLLGAGKAARDNSIALVSALVFGLAAHLFAFSNKLVNADEIESLFGKGATVTSGRWGLELIKPIFPDASMPWLWGMVSLVLLAVSACLIIRLFEIKSPLMQVLVAGMLTAFPSQTGVFCFMFTSAPYALAFLLAVLAVRLFVRGNLPGRCLAALSLILSLSIYQAYIAVTAALFLTELIRRCLDEDRGIGQLLLFAFRALGMLLAALAVYIGITFLVLNAAGTEFNSYVTDNVNGYGLLGRIRMAYDFFFYTLSYREFALATGEMSRYLHILCLGLCLVCLGLRVLAMLREKRLPEALFMLFCAALMPLAVYSMFLVMDKGSIHSLVVHAFYVFYVLAALLADRLLSGERLLCRLGRDVIYISLALCLMSNVFFANKTYIKLHLQYESAYSFYSILLARVQGTEGYDEDCKLAIIGYQDNALTEYPQIDLGYLMGPSHDLINIYSRENFLRRYMGSTIPLADEAELEEISRLEEFKAMSEYPYYGSVKKIDDYIVVKLG